MVPGLIAMTCLVGSHRLLGMQASVVVVCGLQGTSLTVMVRGIIAPQHEGTSWIRDGTSVPCVASQILYHWATREAL